LATSGSGRLPAPHDRNATIWMVRASPAARSPSPSRGRWDPANRPALHLASNPRTHLSRETQERRRALGGRWLVGLQTRSSPRGTSRRTSALAFRAKRSSGRTRPRAHSRLRSGAIVDAGVRASSALVGMAALVREEPGRRAGRRDWLVAGTPPTGRSALRAPAVLTSFVDPLAAALGWQVEGAKRTLLSLADLGAAVLSS
jgi:hypothetical protein